MSDIRAHFKIEPCTQGIFNNLITGLGYYAHTFADVNLYDFGQYTINDLTDFVDGAFRVDTMGLDNQGDFKAYYLPNGNYINFRRGSTNWVIELKLADGTTQRSWTTYPNSSTGSRKLYFIIAKGTNLTDQSVSVVCGLASSAYEAGEPTPTPSAVVANVVWHRPRTETDDFFGFSWIVTEDPYQTAPITEGGEGGYGDFDYEGDDVDFSSLPNISVVNSGFVTLFHPTLQQLQDLAAYMWTGLFDLANFRKIFADPMDCIISLNLIPVNPTDASTAEIKVGNIGTGITCNVLPAQFVNVTFKTKNFGQRTKTFLDYSPYTKAQICLPFIGIRSLAIDDIAGKDLTLQYAIDLFTGACIAKLRVDTDMSDSVLYQFTGNVVANIPLTSASFSSFISSTIAAVGTAVAAATGAAPAAGAIASAVNAAASMKPDIEKSGNLSATAGFLGQQVPYMIFTCPKVAIPGGREKVVGQPSFVGIHPSTDMIPTDYPLSRFHGYTKVHKINLKSIPCTDQERDMIAAQLTEGVILP